MKQNQRKNDSKFCRLNVSDEGGKITALYMDNAREKKWSNYLDNHPKITEEDIVVVIGKKKGDIMFVDKLSVIDTQVFLKVSSMKD